MTNKEIIDRIKTLVRNERRITNELLRHLSLGEQRRVYLEENYSSMYQWLTAGLGYSNTAAQRRLDAARLLKWVPEAFGDLEEGTLNLTNLARAQTVIASEERRSGVQLSRQERASVVQRLEKKTTFEAERELLSIFPDAAPALKPDSKKVVTADITRLSVNCRNEMLIDLQRVREILSNKMPHATDGDLIAHVLAAFVERHEERTTAAVDPCVKLSKVKRRKILMKQAGERCQWVNEETGERCPSRFRLEEDHRIPKALGGGDDLSNMRILCRAHNQMMADRIFGRAKMDRYRKDAELTEAPRIGVATTTASTDQPKLP